MKKYTGHKIPDQSTLKKNYVRGLMKKLLQNFKISLDLFGLQWMKPQTPTAGISQMLL